MKNVRKSKFNLDNVSEFDVSGYKQLLLSTSTQEELVNKELPLVNTGVILEDLVTCPNYCPKNSVLIKP